MSNNTNKEEIINNFLGEFPVRNHILGYYIDSEAKEKRQIEEDVLNRFMDHLNQNFVSKARLEAIVAALERNDTEWEHLKENETLWEGYRFCLRDLKALLNDTNESKQNEQ